jgi:hypothetical protein
VIVLLATAAALVACGRDAAKEEAIAMKPGLYEVKLTGGGVAQLAQPGPRVNNGEICVGGTHGGYLPQKLAKNYLAMGDSCGAVAFERIGNAVTGKFSCTLDPQRATGDVKTTFSGIISEERFDLDAQTTFDATFNDPADQREMQASGLSRGVAIKLTAQRKGDCNPS